MKYFSLLFLLIFMATSQIEIEDCVLYYQVKGKNGVARGKVVYATDFYKIQLNSGGKKEFNKNDIIGITIDKPKELADLEKEDSAKIVEKMPQLLLDEKISAFGWVAYGQFIYSTSLIAQQQYGKAINASKRVDVNAIKRSLISTKVDLELLRLVEFEAKIAKGELTDIRKNLEQLLDVKDTSDLVFNYATYLIAKLFEKEGKTDWAIIHYLKVVFLEKDATVYRLASIRRIIELYKEDGDSRYKKFEEHLKSILKN